MPDTTVQYFWDGMPGLTTISAAAGTLTNFLKACLVDGCGSVTVSSLVVASGVATVSVNAGHGLVYVSTSYPVVEISGATPGTLNGRWRVASIPSSTSFTFACPGIPDQTATGTITSKRASLGWEVAFAETNKMVFRSLNPASPRPYIRVDDNAQSKFAYFQMFETMTDINTGTNSSAAFIYKSYTTDTAGRLCQLYGDDRTIYLCITPGDQQGFYYHIAYIGDFLSYKSGDAFASGHCIGWDNNGWSHRFSQCNVGATTDHWLLRSYSQTGGQIGFFCQNHYSFYAGIFGVTALPGYPSPVDNAFHAIPIEVWESQTVLRGVLPGVVVPLHNYNVLPTGLVVPNVLVNGTLRDFQVRAGYSGARFAFDLTGPWR